MYLLPSLWMDMKKLDKKSKTKKIKRNMEKIISKINFKIILIIL